MVGDLRVGKGGDGWSTPKIEAQIVCSWRVSGAKFRAGDDAYRVFDGDPWYTTGCLAVIRGSAKHKLELECAAIFVRVKVSRIVLLVGTRPSIGYQTGKHDKI